MADAVQGRQPIPDARGAARACPLARRAAAARRCPPRLLPRHHRVAAAGPLAQQGDDTARADRARCACHALRESRAAPHFRRGAGAGRRASRPRGAHSLRGMPRNPGRRTQSAIARPAPAAVHTLLPGFARHALFQAVGISLVHGRSSARRAQSARSCRPSCAMPNGANGFSRTTRPKAAGSEATRVRRAGMASISTGMANGAMKTTRCARARRRSSTQLPLVRIREHAPEVMFSVLTPGTHILPHRGVTNTRVVCHLPLVVPEDCALVVGGEQHEWREGEAVAFDDTYEHEAWNRGTTHTRRPDHRRLEPAPHGGGTRRSRRRWSRRSGISTRQQAYEREDHRWQADCGGVPARGPGRDGCARTPRAAQAGACRRDGRRQRRLRGLCAQQAPRLRGNRHRLGCARPAGVHERRPSCLR